MTFGNRVRRTVDLESAARTCGGTVMTQDGRETGVDSLEEMGPVDYLVIEFPECHPVGENLPLLIDLVDQGIIRILDLALVKREFDGSMSLLALADVDADGEWDLTVFEGVSTGLLDEETVDEAVQIIEPGR